MTVLTWLVFGGACAIIPDSTLTARVDQDGDGFWHTKFGGEDCDDSDSGVYPGADDPPWDGLDANCDEANEMDLDQDGYDAAEAGGDDCDDADPTVFPGASEQCNGRDDDCDTLVPLDEKDADADGVATCEGDCDDTNPSRRPTTAEVCDEVGTDEDCDGTINDGDETVTGTRNWYEDRDGDGFGDVLRLTESCAPPSGYVAASDDCDDADSDVYPGASYFWDEDGDGWGDALAPAVECAPGPGEVPRAGDCGPADPQIFPEAPERCNEVDDDCDGEVDEVADAADSEVMWYRDADGDGYGDDNLRLRQCTSLPGYVHVALDCDDGEPTINPDGAEKCGGTDEDCDGMIDDADPDVIDAPTWYPDADGDGAGEAGTVRVACDPGEAWGLTDDDCAPDDPLIYPAAAEICNDADDDCDTLIDADDPDVNDALVYYADADLDGFGDPSSAGLTCDVSAEIVADANDCDDADAAVNPAAIEVCATAWDDNCDGEANEAETPDCTTHYADTDLDGFGDPANARCDCEATAAWPLNAADDCDDANNTIHPEAAETCATWADDDCDGVADAEGASGCVERYYDADYDGFGTGDAGCHCAGRSAWRSLHDSDCDDANESVYPTAPVVCMDAIDSDCDNMPDECVLSDAFAVLRGADEGDSAGATVYGPGDLDGDGFAELFIGMPDNSAAAVDGGAACLVFGPPGDGLVQDAALCIYPDLSDVSLGSALGSAGDLDGDGVRELLVGADEDDTTATNAGAAYVMSGAWRGNVASGNALITLLGTAKSDAFGSAIVGGDFDGSGIDEIAVGAPGDDDGSVRIVEGATSFTLRASDAHGDAGRRLATLPDTDGDGLVDLAVAAYAGSIEQVWVVGAPEPADAALDDVGWALTADDDESADLGSGLAGADLDGDGYGDLLVGAEDYNAGGLTSAGSIFIFYGPLPANFTTAEANVSISGTVASEYVGQVCVLGDLDADGHQDVAVGGPGHDPGGRSSAGGIWLFFGPLTGTMTTTAADDAYFGDTASDALGGKLAALGDATGDGLPDVAAGSSAADAAAGNEGAVWLLSSDTP